MIKAQMFHLSGDLQNQDVRVSDHEVRPIDPDAKVGGASGDLDSWSVVGGLFRSQPIREQLQRLLLGRSR